MNRRTLFKILAALPFINRIPAVRTYIDTNLAPSTDAGLQPGWEAMIYSIQCDIKAEVEDYSDACQISAVD